MTREQFWAQDSHPLEGAAKHKAVSVRQMNETGQTLAEITIDSGLGGEPVELLQLSDIHINRVTAQDKDDEEIMRTLTTRQAFSTPEVVVSLDRMMQIARFFDKLIVTGDTLDFMSAGSLDTAKRMMFNVYRDGLYIVGGHEFAKEVQTGVPEQLPYETREEMVQAFWPGNIYFQAHDVKDKVICVGLDNDMHYRACQVEPLKQTIERARKEKKIVLVFQHEPVSTGKPEDEHAPTIKQGWQKEWNVYSGAVIGGPDHTNEDDVAVLTLLKENADVVKGIFHGHYHDILYTEIPAFYTDENGRHETVIPQLGASGCCYFSGGGVGTHITVK